MSYVSAIAVVDRLILETADKANAAALCIQSFDSIGAGSGVAIRLQALRDVRVALIDAGMKDREQKLSTTHKEPS